MMNSGGNWTKYAATSTAGLHSTRLICRLTRRRRLLRRDASIRGLTTRRSFNDQAAG